MAGSPPLVPLADLQAEVHERACFVFFRIHSALCLDPQAGGKAAKRRVLCFLAALWAFAFRPLLGVR